MIGGEAVQFDAIHREKDDDSDSDEDIKHEMATCMKETSDDEDDISVRTFCSKKHLLICLHRQNSRQLQLFQASMPVKEDRVRSL